MQTTEINAKCASYDWDRGLGTCHNCDKSFQLHTYQRKGKAEKVYIKPEQVAIHNEPGMKVEEWFKTRGISHQTLIDLKVTEGPEWMMVERILNYTKVLKKYFIILTAL